MKVMRKFCRTPPKRPTYHLCMINAEGAPTRTLTLFRPYAVGRPRRPAEPDAVAWLQARIRERLASPEPSTSSYAPPAAAPAADHFWGEDEY